MSTSKKLIVLLLLTSLVPLAASADVLMLKNGQAITGKFQGADSTTVNFLSNGQTRSYSINDVNSITFTSSPSAPPAAERNAPDGHPTLSRRSEPYNNSGSSGGLTPSPSADYGTSPAAASSYPAPDGRPTLSRRSDPSDNSGSSGGLTPSPQGDYGTSPAAASSYPAPDGRPTLSRRSEPSNNSGSSGGLSSSPSADYGTSTVAASSPPAPAAPKQMNVTVHAGSVITVRMIDPVDSAKDTIGQTFRASLDDPLVVDGVTVVPRGAEVTAKLVSKAEAGRIQGRSELTLMLMDITIQGLKREITTSEVTKAGSSRGTQSAERIGGAAAIGAVIGAIAGGGKGAAIGAATGGAAGGAVQVLTHGAQVKIPAETRLEFTLAQPLNL